MINEDVGFQIDKKCFEIGMLSNATMSQMCEYFDAKCVTLSVHSVQ